MRPDRWLRRWLSIRDYRRVLENVTTALVGGKHAEAESICERALRLHASARRFALAVPLSERALAIAECESGVDYAVVSAIRAWLAAARVA